MFNAQTQRRPTPGRTVLGGCLVGLAASLLSLALPAGDDPGQLFTDTDTGIEIGSFDLTEVAPTREWMAV